MGCLGIETHRIIHPSFSSLSSLWGISFPTQEGNRADIDVWICCTKTVTVQLCMSEGRALRTAVPEPQQPLCSTAWQHPQPWQNYTQWDNGFPTENNTLEYKKEEERTDISCVLLSCLLLTLLPVHASTMALSLTYRVMLKSSRW